MPLAMKLGRQPAVPTPDLPALHTYSARAPLPVPPLNVDWSRDCGDWPMLANDVVGDCTIAAALHHVQAAVRWHDGVPLRGTDADALAGYRAVGWDGVGEGGGALLSDVMRTWKCDGLPFHGAPDQITEFVRVTQADLKAALWLCGPILLGLDLPLAAAQQDVWRSPASLAGADAPRSWGGHCALLVALDGAGNAKLVTWGAEKMATAGWLAAYFDEAWAVLHPAWVASGISPAGWLASTLADDMGRLGK